MKAKIVISAIFMIVLYHMSVFGQDYGTFTDNRDDKVYRWVLIGNQIWMAENLDYNSGRGSGQYDKIYGRLYNWETAKRACPRGWHLPSDDEWKELEYALGMSDSELEKEYSRKSGDVGLELKSTSGWRPSFFGENGNGIDSYGFRALPGGYYQTYTKRFMYYGSAIYLWTSTSIDSENARMRSLDSNDGGIGRESIYKVHGCYCRCIKDRE